MNNLEIKVGSKKDTVNGEKKIQIFEALTFGGSYNIYADSMNYSPINIAGRTNIYKNLNMNMNAVLDPYMVDTTAGRIIRYNTLVYDSLGKIGRLTSLTLALNLSFTGGDKHNSRKTTSKYATREELDAIYSQIDDYVDFNVPWSLNVNYNFIINRPAYIATITNSLTFSGDVKLTNKWKIGVRSGYDIVQKQLTYTSVDIYRDLHCWEMRFNVIPFGPRQSYRFDINVKSSVLQDLKLTRRREWFDRTSNIN
jgi:hypothetical protein